MRDGRVRPYSCDGPLIVTSLAKGLPPLPRPTSSPPLDTAAVTSTQKQPERRTKPEQPASSSFSLGGAASSKRTKRKVVGDAEDTSTAGEQTKPGKKKQKKAPKVGLSFADDDA